METGAHLTRFKLQLLLPVKVEQELPYVNKI